MKATTPIKSRVIKKAEKALKAAGKRAVEEHREKKLPLVAWKNGRVAKIPANQL